LGQGHAGVLAGFDVAVVDQALERVCFVGHDGIGAVVVPKKHLGAPVAFVQHEVERTAVAGELEVEQERVFGRVAVKFGVDSEFSFTGLHHFAHLLLQLGQMIHVDARQFVLRLIVGGAGRALLFVED